MDEYRLACGACSLLVLSTFGVTPFMHNAHDVGSLPVIPSHGPLGVGGTSRYDESGRLRLAHSGDTMVTCVYGSVDGPTHPPVTFPPDRPSWLEQQKRRALANLPKVGL